MLAEFPICKACLHAVGKNEVEKITAKVLKTKLLALNKTHCCHLYRPNVNVNCLHRFGELKERKQCLMHPFGINHLPWALDFSVNC